MITLIKQATIVNEGKVFVSDLLIEGERIKENIRSMESTMWEY